MLHCYPSENHHFIDEIGSDLKNKDIGVEQIIFGYSFLPKGNDINNNISITKWLSKFCS
jgi:hypothetical protein